MHRYGKKLKVICECPYLVDTSICMNKAICCLIPKNEGTNVEDNFGAGNRPSGPKIRIYK